MQIHYSTVNIPIEVHFSVSAAIMESTTNEESASFPSLIAQSSILGEATATTTTAITTSKAANSGIVEETTEVFVMPSSPLLEPTPG